MTTCIPELPCSLVNLGYICIRLLALSVYIQELSSEDQSSRDAPIEDEAAAAALNFARSAGVRDRFAWCRCFVGRVFSVRISTCLHAKAHQPASVHRHRHIDTDTDTDTGTDTDTDRRQTCAHIILIKPQLPNPKDKEEHRIAGPTLNSSLPLCEVLCHHPPSRRSLPPPPMLTPFCASGSCGFGRAGSERMHDNTHTHVHARTRTCAHTRNRWRRERALNCMRAHAPLP
jgi:hypothetical protein